MWVSFLFCQCHFIHVFGATIPHQRSVLYVSCQWRSSIRFLPLCLAHFSVFQWMATLQQNNFNYKVKIWALPGGEWSASRPCRLFTPGETARGTHWVGRRTGQCQSGRCGEEKTHFLQPAIEPRSLSHSARSRLSYQLCCEIHVS
jgi:hypothetical protein